MALVVCSGAFQPCFIWAETIKTFWPGLGWPNRPVY